MRDNLKKVIAVIALVIILLAGASALFQWHQADDIQQKLAATRQALHEQGFRTDLKEFNLTADAAAQARAAALVSFNSSALPSDAASRVNLLPVAGGGVVVVWKQDWLSSEDGELAWPDLRSMIDGYEPQLETARDAALAGPIRFSLDASQGAGMMLRHTAPMRGLGWILGAQVISDLQAGQFDGAWTNLLAETRLATAWNVEPADISYMVRNALVATAFNTTWQSLQAGRWSDDELARLQQEWESMDLFTNLSEVAAFRRASLGTFFAQSRARPLGGGVPLLDIIRQFPREPLASINSLKQYWNQAHYRSYGIFDDERNLLLYYQKREVDLRQAETAPTWTQMQLLSAVTNADMYQSPYRSTLVPVMGMARMGPRSSGTSNLLTRLVVGEARRRITIAAIGLERFHLAHGTYPKTLAELAPAYMRAVPVDFIDGKPLHYRPTDDGHFILYSIGLSAVDDGGLLPPPSSSSRPSRFLGGPMLEPAGCIVWPRPATPAEVETWRTTLVSTNQMTAGGAEGRAAGLLWQHLDKRQAEAGKLLAMPAVTTIPELDLSGRPLSEILAGAATDGTNRLSLAGLFTLKQRMTGQEPETVTFDLPIAYDAARNVGRLDLMVDPDYTAGDDEGSGAQVAEWERADNGSSLLVWHAIYESPGAHALQAAFTFNGREKDVKPDVCGPYLAFNNTNLCQFTPASAHFTFTGGAVLHARVPEPRADFVVNLVTTNNQPLKTISGSTSNGEFIAYWDLVDDRGERFAGAFFNSVFHLSLPDSGRAQTLRGP